MRTFTKCPYCSNKSIGDIVYRCKGCGQIHCSMCCPSGCPSCGSDDNSRVGEIDESEDN